MLFFLHFLSLLMIRYLGSSFRVSCILSLRQFTRCCLKYSVGRPVSAVPQSRFTTGKEPCSVEQLVSGTIIIHNFQKYSNILPPFATAQAFGSDQPLQTKLQVVPVLSSTLLPGFIGRNFITTTDSSATSHCIGLS